MCSVLTFQNVIKKSALHLPVRLLLPPPLFLPLRLLLHLPPAWLSGNLTNLFFVKKLRTNRFATALFDAEHDLEERILKEQFTA